MKSYELEIYQQGRESASSGLRKKSCTYGVSEASKRHIWLAGWHDWHIENETGVYA